MQFMPWLIASTFMMVLATQTTQAAHAVHSDPPITVGILLFDGVQIIDFAAPYEVFGQARFGVYTVSADGREVNTAMGLAVQPDHSFASMPTVDIVLVPGGDIGAAAADSRTRNWLQRQAAGVEHVLSVCTGSHILASAGLLNGLSATTFYPAINGLRHDNPAVNVIDTVRYADNGKIITSAGLSSGIDAALHLVAKILGTERAKTIAMHLEYDWRPAHDFIRAQMADRHLPNLKIDWPEQTRFKRVHHYGDQKNWVSRHQGTTRLSEAELIQLFTNAMAQHSDWSPLPHKNGDQRRWLKISGDEDILLSFNIELTAHTAEAVLELAVNP